MYELISTNGFLFKFVKRPLIFEKNLCSPVTSDNRFERQTISCGTFGGKIGIEKVVSPSTM
jgi:hypothetical protein